VSIPVTFDDLVGRASAVAVVIPIEQRAVWEDGRIATYTRVRIDRSVAGRLVGEISVRTEGGAVGHIGQIVEGEAVFTMGRTSLVFLHPQSNGGSGAFGVVEGAQGQFSIAIDAHQTPRLAISPSLGGLVPPASASPLARDVLVDVALGDATKTIATAWTRRHPASQDTP
jgi:hypothetical protein